jgi:hypothetical protein
MYEMHSNPSVRPDPIDWLAMHGQPGPWSAAEKQAIIDKGQTIIDSMGRARNDSNSFVSTVVNGVNNLLDVIPPCDQIILGSFVVFSTPFVAFEIAAVGIGGAPETGGATLALLFALQDDLVLQPLAGIYLLNRGITRGGCK